MLYQQELAQANETIAARDAEVQDLKARVAELEELQQQQQQLITLKDSELAASQQRLQETNAATAGEPATVAGVTSSPWLWVGVGALVVALLAWAWLAARARRREAESRRFLNDSPAPAPVSASASSAAMAEAMASAAPTPAPAAAPEPEPEFDRFAAQEEAPASRQGGTATPFWHATGSEGAALAAKIAPLNPAPAGNDRLELARAYLDLGDAETARSLLLEVAESGDDLARNEAQRLLRSLA